MTWWNGTGLRRPAIALVVAGTLLGLSGCGSARPGVAAQIGSETITLNRVDDLSGAYCSAVSRQLKGEGRVVPLSMIRSAVVQTLVMRSGAEQLAAKFDVKPGAAYAESRSALEQGTAVLEPEEREAVLTLETGQDFVSDVLQAAGKVSLEQQGIPDSDIDSQLAAGKDQLALLFAQEDPQIDPSFGLVMQDYQPVSADTNTSFAFSSVARQATKDTPDDTFIRSLPRNQVCG